MAQGYFIVHLEDNMEEDDVHRFLCVLLNGTVGYSENEIKQINL